MSTGDRYKDPDDLFADTRMSFGDHIEELRSRLLRALVGFTIGFMISFLPWVGAPVLEFIKSPVEAQLAYFYDRRVETVAEKLKSGDRSITEVNEAKELVIEFDKQDLARVLGIKLPQAEDAAADTTDAEWVAVRSRLRPVEVTMMLNKAQQLVGKRPLLATMSVMEAFMVYMKVCAVCGILIGSPWIFYQLWAFVAAGLYPHEKRYVHLYLPLSLVLFLAGVFMCEFLVIPKAIQGLLWFNEWLGLEPDLRLNEWLSFALLLPLVFGLSFQTPLVMLFLAKVGIMDVESFRRKRRIAWFAMAAFAAIITPIDALSMILLWVPMCALYELGILMVQYSAKTSEDDLDITEPEEMVGV
ncbi:MAG TPA: twin-arginine translocase subunit TatC [Gemmataceae bacterium]|nr:twin-arginine translocase subunit TatC [Gemmataceae bacterium]